jgi:hypothetical protein
MNLGKIIVNIQLYYIFCLLYFLIGCVNENSTNSYGTIVYFLLLYTSPVFIIGPFIFFSVIKKADYKRDLLLVLLFLALTILFFEFFLKS